MAAKLRRLFLVLAGLILAVRLVYHRRRANDADNYYLRRREWLLREFDLAVRRTRHVVAARYGVEGADEIIAETRQEYDALIPQLPYIGGKQPLTQFLISTAWFLALYRVLKRRGRSLDEAGKLCYQLTEALLESFPTAVGRMIGGRPFSKRYLRKLRKRAAESQERQYPGDYVYNFIEGDGQTFDFGVDAVECAAYQFLQAQDARELTPYLCAVDRLYSEAFGWGLARTGTLAEGCDKCDFRFRKGKPTWVASTVIPSTFVSHRQHRHHPRLYRKVPQEQVDRLLTFRAEHPYRYLKVTGMEWEYIACGHGDETLLILPGGLRLAESAFHHIESFEDHWRVIVPTYPAVMTIDEMTDGLVAILNAENIPQAIVVGQSYGGWVAQVLARRYPERVKKLVLSGTGPLAVSRAERTFSRVAVNLAPHLPERMLMNALRHALVPLVTAQERERGFWRAFVNDIFSGYLTKADILSHFRTGADTIRKGYLFNYGDVSTWPGEVLVIVGEHDPAVSESDLERFEAIYPRIRIEVIGGAGHTVGLANPARYAALVDGFIRGEQPANKWMAVF
jgi:pimeloyl-ACP methyl ester carboxylesterase